jgi:hypothetical protein
MRPTSVVLVGSGAWGREPAADGESMGLASTRRTLTTISIMIGFFTEGIDLGVRRERAR